MAVTSEISQRDLRMRSRDIMDAVERGESFTVTRDGREIGQLVPLRQRRRFVPREEFTMLGRGLGTIDADEFFRDIEALADPTIDDPFER